MSHRVVIAILVFLSLSMGIVVFLATVNGPWGYSDSVEYIVSARNLIAGLGFGMFYPSGRFVTTYLHPPLYPLLLSSMGIFGIDLVDAARWLNIGLGMTTVFFTGFIFLRFSRYSEYAVLAVVLTMFFPTTFEMFTSSMSEGLFLFLLVAGCFLLLQNFEKPTRRRLFITAFCFGLLPLTRYVGVAYILSAAVCILLFAAGSGRDRVKDAFLFGFSASLPILIWFIVLYFGASRGLGGRSIGVDWEYLAANFIFYRDAMTEILWNWIPFSRRSFFSVLYNVRYFFLTSFFLAILALTGVSLRRLMKQDGSQVRNPDIQIAVIFGTGMIVYLLVFTANWLFTDPQPDIITRLLMPIYFGGILAFLGCWAVVQKAWFPRDTWYVRTLPWLFAIISVYWYSPQVVDVLTQSRENNTVIAYRWHDSQMIRALKDLPADQVLISNKAEVVLMWADRPAYDLLERLKPGFIRETTMYGSDETDTVQEAFRQGALLVVFNDFPDQLSGTYGGQGKKRLESIFDGLIVFKQYPDGVIYLYPAQ